MYIYYTILSSIPFDPHCYSRRIISFLLKKIQNLVKIHSEKIRKEVRRNNRTTRESSTWLLLIQIISSILLADPRHDFRRFVCREWAFWRHRVANRFQPLLKDVSNVSSFYAVVTW